MRPTFCEQAGQRIGSNVSKRTMRIGILGDPNDVHVRRWCSGLSARGLEMWNLCGRLPALRERGVGYLELASPSLSLENMHLRKTRFRRRFQALFEQFDIIHIHNLHHWGIDPSICGRGRLMVSTYGTDVLPEQLPRLGQNVEVDQNPHTGRMKKMTLSLADHITATSDYLAVATAAYGGIPREQISVVHFGVDPERFAPRRKQRSECGTVGFVGGYRPCKGARVLVEAVPAVIERFPDCVFELFGAAEQNGPCAEQATRLRIGECVRFREFVPHGELPDVMDSFDVLAVPSIVEEAYCVAGLESQAMEVPVVASRAGGLPDTIQDRRTGLLVKPDSPEALARGICALLGDETLRRAYGEAGRTWVTSYHDWSASLDLMVAAYERVMSGYSRRTNRGAEADAELIACK